MGKPIAIGLDRLMRLPDLSADLGPRAAIGLFMQPMSAEFSWSRDVFSLAFALQNLLWDTTYQNGIRCDSYERRTAPTSFSTRLSFAV
jgi:hypothetical protein